MNSMFIALFRIDEIFGHFGRGPSKEDAINALKKAGGKWSKRAMKEGRCALWQFTSDLPFVPIGNPRTAKESEADVYVAKSGDLCWIRCERTELALDGSTTRYLHAPPQRRGLLAEWQLRSPKRKTTRAVHERRLHGRDRQRYPPQ